MNEGLITRLGKWLDERWEANVKVSDLQGQEQKCCDRHLGALKAIAEAREMLAPLDVQIEEIKGLVKSDGLNKEMAELKTRIERLEVGTGMYRKIDTTKAPVAKTAFQM